MTRQNPATHPGILLLSGVRGDTRRYRSLHLAEQCRLLGLPTHLTHITDPLLRRIPDTKAIDVAILHRVQMDRHLEALLKDLEHQETLILYDTDDLIFDPSAIQYIDSPDFSDPVRRRLYRRGVEAQREALLACHAALASTQFLAGQIAELGLPVRVHRNALSREMARLAAAAREAHAPAGEPVVIGYASGTPTHDRDFALVAPALQDLMRRESRVRLHLVGPLDPGPGWTDLTNQIRRIPAVPWRELPWLLADFDINLAPLVQDNPFARSKSAIKFMEAALVATPTIASPTDAFQHAIRHGENGLLAGDPSAWQEALTRLVSNPSLRRDLGARAARDVQRDDAPETRAKELAESLEALSWSARECPLWPKKRPTPTMPLEGPAWPLAQESQPTNWQLGLYTLRWRGPLPLLGGLWVWIRRRLAPIIPFRPRQSPPHGKDQPC